MSQPPRSNAFIALCCGVFVTAMVGAAYAAVPLYDMFCKATGYGGVTRVAEVAPASISDRTFGVSFDANINKDLPWTFAPERRRVSLRAGEVRTVMYRITNTTDKPTTGIAAYNVTPTDFGPYFSKIQCFCFTEQTLGPHETLELPVVFFVDPAVSENHNLDSLKEVTLSYTYYAAKPKAKPVATNQAPVRQAPAPSQL